MSVHLTRHMSIYLSSIKLITSLTGKIWCPNWRSWMTLMTSFIKWPKDTPDTERLRFRWVQWLVTKMMLLDETNHKKAWVDGFWIENFQHVSEIFLAGWWNLFSVLHMICLMVPSIKLDTGCWMLFVLYIYIIPIWLVSTTLKERRIYS